jgi:hypothetical protein
MGGGGKQTTTSAVEIPAWLEAAAQRNLAKADTLSQIGYTPYYGPDVAAMTPMQLAAMQGTNTAASAFGMPTADPMAGMPAAQNYGGMQAYSSGSLYDQALAELQRRQPGQYAALRAPFIDPVTGAQPLAPYGSGGGYAGGGGGYAGGGSSYGGSAAPAIIDHNRGRGDSGGSAPSGGGGGTRSLDSIGSYAPGGVNTNNPSSLGNRMAASLSGPQGKPTAQDRPVARDASKGGGAGQGGKK